MTTFFSLTTFLTTFFISLTIVVVSVFGTWKIFQKAGQKGWEAIIPFYNSYVLSKIVWGSGWYFLLSLIPFGGFIYNIITYIKLGKAFNKGTGFIVGLVLFSPVFLVLMGIDSSCYMGPSQRWKTATIATSLICGVISMILAFIFSVFATFAAIFSAIPDSPKISYIYEDDSGFDFTLPGSESSDSVSAGSPAQIVAEEFIKSLAAKDYDKALSCFGLNDKESFVVAKDIEFYLPRSSFSEALNINGATSFVSKENISSSAEKTFTVSATDAMGSVFKFEVKTKLNDNNEWVVDVPEFYNTNFSFRTAGGNVKVFVNDKELSKELCTASNAGTSGLSRVYKLPYVGKKDISVKLVCDNYEFTESLTTENNNPDNSENIPTVYKKLDEDEQKKVLDVVKTLYNKLVTAHQDKKDALDMLDYIAKDGDSDICKQIWDNLDRAGKKDIKMTLCNPWPDEDIFYVTENKIVVNFACTISWIGYTGSTVSENMLNSIILSKDGSDYKIYSVPNTDLFSYFNQFKKDW